MEVEKLQEMRDWAQGKIDNGTEPPWAWSQYMKLIETLDVIIAGSNCIVRDYEVHEESKGNEYH